ncbi:tumor necrosis factor receptor superfamily member 6 isoform X2 [Phyllopteryx taeniolatus]|uniref:tumor necrosis factor receptor superfamily member 6 isoform X2 n=1 Tax=Phyllopteryx taeniolatus TaxID=161469 RepID=UPI002AD3A75D|nr:tumor necrosis factor receptor superfamily member 6 isoform X2 [Phyllopteryx taeniolatus]
MKASSCSCTFLTCFFILVLFDSSSTLGVRASLLLRSQKKREAQQCPDGLYQHGTIACCLCAIGQRLEQHCPAGSPEETECDQCESGTYNSHPNQDRNCQRCTSCSHPNANLEVETPCTVASDTKCRCKTHHYCISANDQDCKLCSPCTECGMEGIKVACTATNDTVCNAKLEGRNHVWTGVAVACVLVVIILVLSIQRNRKNRRSNRQSSNNPTTFEVEMQSFSHTDPIRHLPAVAEVLGWTTMADVAIRSGMNPNIIDSLELDYPRNSQEQTLQLLRMWVEEQGMDAMKKLIQILRNIKKNYKAQNVLDVLSDV